MSAGLQCDCPLPPMETLSPHDYGHRVRPNGLPGCPQYAEDQECGGRCRFCADAERIGHAWAARQALAPVAALLTPPDPETESEKS